MMKTMMKLMKMSELLLILSCVLCVSFCEDDHQDLNIFGCSDSDGEFMYTLDGEEVYYADFNKGEGVYPQPPFINHISYGEGAYEQALTLQQICKANLKNSRIGMKDIPVESDPPSGHTLYSTDEVELGVQNTLICHVTGFYPAPVKVEWTKNGKTVTEGTSINVPYPNKDRSFSQSSRLVFTPQQGDMYSCSVSHPSLSKPLTRIWDVEVQQPGVGPAVFCGLGLTIGLLGVAAGTFFLIKGNECSYPPSGHTLYSRDEVELGVQNTLICHVTGFFPAPVKVYWTKNGKTVTEGTSINIPYPNKDRSFSQSSRLVFTPQQGDMYSCSVSHPSLSQPLTRIWDVEVQQPGVGPAVFCGLGVTIGLLGVAAGTFFLIKGNECS
ncbi:SLA class II histocompatibility antigen, DQ haplotype D alpha chain-like [Scomber japonicus]|uniref:SLA class II histocompatibility antigen, DQ haplotype D alpha chain-like n=1 Tax=Scomber japonicus TaxID=13676 RepID=UPI0023062E6C|nr:SLA class II histocompatibility antigen, DQ haplotype D alpha chain-like [Scomber japonicus]